MKGITTQRDAAVRWFAAVPMTPFGLQAGPWRRYRHSVQSLIPLLGILTGLILAPTNSWACSYRCGLVHRVGFRGCPLRTIDRSRENPMGVTYPRPLPFEYGSEFRHGAVVDHRVVPSLSAVCCFSIGRVDGGVVNITDHRTSAAVAEGCSVVIDTARGCAEERLPLRPPGVTALSLVRHGADKGDAVAIARERRDDDRCRLARLLLSATRR